MLSCARALKGWRFPQRLRWRSDRGSMRMMTKSAGFTDAMPMTTTSLPVVDVGLGHSGAIDFDEMASFGPVPLERRSRQMLLRELLRARLPLGLAVWLEDHPLQLLVDGSLDENHRALH